MQNLSFITMPDELLKTIFSYCPEIDRITLVNKRCNSLVENMLEAASRQIATERPDLKDIFAQKIAVKTPAKQIFFQLTDHLHLSAKALKCDVVHPKQIRDRANKLDEKIQEEQNKTIPDRKRLIGLALSCGTLLDRNAEIMDFEEIYAKRINFEWGTFSDLLENIKWAEEHKA